MHSTIIWEGFHFVIVLPLVKPLLEIDQYIEKDKVKIFPNSATKVLYCYA